MKNVVDVQSEVVMPVDVDDAEVELEKEVVMDEGKEALRRRPAARPSEDEVRRHRATHIPFRDWCPECIAGAANDWPHKKRSEPVKLKVPELHCDYCFPKDSIGGDYIVVLVCRDRESRMTMAHVVPCKGGEQEWVTEQVARDVVKLGYHDELVLRSDQEPAIVDLLREVAKVRGSKRTFLEQSPVADSQANGVAERAVQAVEKMLRVHKLALESKLGEKVPVKHPVIPWLVEHVANVMNRHLVSSDGLTAEQRLKGKQAEQYVLEFGAACMFRVVGKVEGANMSERWLTGLWLGKKFGTEEHIVLRPDGLVVRARAVREIEKKISLKDFDHLRSAPHDPLGTLRGIPRDPHRRVDAAEGNGLPGDDPVQAAKRVQITADAIKKFGPTPGCRKCKGVMAGDRSYQYVHHSEDCRKRLEEKMMHDEGFKENLERASRRQVERLAQELERRVKEMENQKGEKSEASAGPLRPAGPSGSGLPRAENGQGDGGGLGGGVDPGGGSGGRDRDLDGDDNMGIPLAVPDTLAQGGAAGSG